MGLVKKIEGGVLPPLFLRKLLPHVSLFSTEMGLPALVFIGKAETFNEEKELVEVHILDFSQEIYDCLMEVEVIKRIRDSQKFLTEEDLVEQMKQDELVARNYFSQIYSPPKGESARRAREGAVKIKELVPQIFLNFSRKLRTEQTPWEHKLWKKLRSGRFYDLKFKRQVFIEKFIVDFYCHEKKLIIEIDGGQHNREINKNLDLKRQKQLEAKGYKILRFWNNEIDENLEGVLEKIKEYCGV